jgi:hypothetical protein
MILAAFGLLTFFFAGAIAAGEPVARSLCLLMLAFWTVRLFVAAFVFDVRPYLKNWFLRLGYQATNVVFLYLVGRLCARGVEGRAPVNLPLLHGTACWRWVRPPFSPKRDAQARVLLPSPEKNDQGTKIQTGLLLKCHERPPRPSSR